MRSEMTVTVRRDMLLDMLRKNREKHAQNFTVAEAGFRRQVIAEMKKNLAEAEKGGAIVTHIQLPRAVEYLDSYDCVLEMLGHSTHEEVEITQTQYDQYVRDRWPWAERLLSNNTRYIAEDDWDAPE